MVRAYTDKPIPADIVEKLNERIAQMNAAHGVQMKLIAGEKAPVWGLMRLMGAKGTRNFLLLGSPDIPDAKEKLGYCGIDIRPVEKDAHILGPVSLGSKRVERISDSNDQDYRDY